MNKITNLFHDIELLAQECGFFRVVRNMRAILVLLVCLSEPCLKNRVINFVSTQRPIMNSYWQFRSASSASLRVSAIGEISKKA